MATVGRNVANDSGEKFGPHKKSMIDKGIWSLYESYRILPGVELVIPSADDSLKRVRPGYGCAYLVYFTHCRLTFPIHEFVCKVLKYLGMAFPYMCPKFVCHTTSLFVRSIEEEMLFEVMHLFKLCLAKSNPKYLGMFYLSPRPTRRIIDDTPNKDTN